MVPILEAIILIGWLLAVFYLWKNRIWLLYFLFGAIGLTFALIFAGQVVHLEKIMEQAVALSVHQVCDIADIPTKIFESSRESLLVMVVGQSVGWTVVKITIECSSLIETAAMLGVVVFYPGWSITKRTALALVGIVAIFIANIIRVFLIVAILHGVGKESLFISHTLIGRAVFFLMVIIIYWYILTLPTLRDIRFNIGKEMSE